MAFVPTPPSFCNARTTSLSPTTFLRRPPHRIAPRVSVPLNRRTIPRCSEMGVTFPDSKYDEQLRIGIASTRWSKQFTEALLSDVKATLADRGINDSNIVEMQVPGAWELPMAARLMCAAQKVDAIICLGVLIKGQTDHYEYIAGPVSSGLMDLQLTLSTPIIFGVLCCTDEEQAVARTTGDKSHARDWALTAIEMAHLRKSQMGGVSAGKKSVGFF